MASSRRRQIDGAAPIREFVAPGRRRTDNPMVVGTIVLCLGVTAFASIVQITATLWAGSHLKLQMENQKTRDEAFAMQREHRAKAAEAQAIVLRRLCLNVAKDQNEQAECLTVVPAPTPSVKRGSN